MPDEFRALIARIKNDPAFESRCEEAVKQGTVLPILRHLGCNPDDTGEVAPQYGMSSWMDSPRQISGTNIFVEVTRGANYIRDRCKTLLDLFGYGYGDFDIELE